MDDGRMTLYGADEYERITGMAKAGKPVLLDGHTYLITETHYDGVEGRGYYKIEHVVTAQPVETLAVIAQGIG
jgi:hypothetical protein